MRMYWLIPIVLAVTVFGLMVVADADDSDATADPSTGTQVGDLYYTFSGSYATIVGYSSSTDWSQFTEIPDGLSYNGHQYWITAIGDYAFQNSGIGQVEWENYGSEIQSIGAYAFSGCTDLEIGMLPQYATIGAYAFQNCTSLEYIESFPDTTSLDEGVFSGCTNLLALELPYDLTSIGAYAFQNCTALELSSLPDLTNIGDYAFSGCTALPLSELSSEGQQLAIGNYAFYNCSNITMSNIPDNVVSIGNHAFDGCSSLTDLVIMGSPTIGTDAFANCPNLVLSANINDLLYSFTGNTATVSGYSEGFEGEVAIPNTVVFSGTTYTVSAIGESAFGGGYNIIITALPSNLASIGNYGLDGPSVRVASLPNTLSTIGAYGLAFSSRMYLTSLPSSLTSVGNNAFSGCSGMTLSEIPEGLISIGNSAFSSCTGIKSLTISGSPTIGSSAFQNCTGLKTLIVEGSPTIGTNAFQGCTNLKQVLNLGDTPITTTSYGLNADEVRTGSEGFDAVTMLQEVGTPGQHETVTVEDTSATATILRTIPIFLVLAVLLAVVGAMYYNSRQQI